MMTTSESTDIRVLDCHRQPGGEYVGVVQTAGRDHFFVLVQHGRHARAVGAVATAWLVTAGVNPDDASGTPVYRDLNDRTYCDRCRSRGCDHCKALRVLLDDLAGVPVSVA